MHTEDQISPRLADSPIAVRPKSRRTTFVVAGVLLLVVLLATGFIPRLLRTSEAKNIANTSRDALPVVITVPPRAATANAQLTLPGNIEAVYVASLYARASGYVKRRQVDIGQRVHTGQLLAEIEAPEIDQQLAQAKATLGQTRAAYQEAKANFYQAQASVSQAQAGLEQANANQEIAQTTDTRWTRLVERGVIPRQQGDERRSAYHARVAETAAAQANIQTAQATVTARQASIEAAQANIAAAEADVRRLSEMVAYERVVAPFDGVITERNVERGDLVTSGGSGPQSHLFSIAQANVLRIQTQVPQIYASDMQDGQTAEVEVRGASIKSVTGKIARTSDALNAQSRTLLVEIQIDNRLGLLLPGMYADVKFALPRAKTLLLVPADTLVINNTGPRVVTVSSDHKIHYKNIQLGRDLGGEIEVLGGLASGDRLVSNPTDALTEGESVQASESKSFRDKA